MKELTMEQLKHITDVRMNVKKGDLITHTRCMGELQEHIFIEFRGKWMYGKPTKLTKKHGTCVSIYADDIHPLNVTHINRQTPEAIILLKELNPETVPPQNQDR